MAVASICDIVGQNFAQGCSNDFVSKYYQQIVLINKSDINPSTIIKDTTTPGAYNVFFALKTGKKGYRFTGNESNRSISGVTEKTKDAVAGVRYNHKVNYTIYSTSQEIKRLFKAFDKGLFVAALQLTNGEVEIYGLDNGLISGDYTLDVSGTKGATALVFQSDEESLENNLPYTFKSADPNANFDVEFAN